MLDCKGVAALVYGGLLCYLVTLSSLGSTIAARLNRINRDRVSWYGRHPGMTPLPHIGDNNLRKDGWADLHGPAFKAAITRNASGFFKHLAGQLLGGVGVNGNFEQWLLSVVSRLDTIYSLMWGRPRFLPANTINELRAECISFGEDYMRCREHCRVRRILSFNVTPKVHKLQHLPAMAEIMNPAWVSCYAEESLVGTTIRVWKQSMHGRYKKMVQRQVLLKRLCGLLLRLED